LLLKSISFLTLSRIYCKLRHFNLFSWFLNYHWRFLEFNRWGCLLVARTCTVAWTHMVSVSMDVWLHCFCWLIRGSFVWLSVVSWSLSNGCGSWVIVFMLSDFVWVYLIDLLTFWHLVLSLILLSASTTLTALTILIFSFSDLTLNHF